MKNIVDMMRALIREMHNRGMTYDNIGNLLSALVGEERGLKDEEQGDARGGHPASG